MMKQLFTPTGSNKTGLLRPFVFILSLYLSTTTLSIAQTISQPCGGEDVLSNRSAGFFWGCATFWNLFNWPQTDARESAAAGGGALVIAVDPVTRQIVQPTDGQIKALVTAPVGSVTPRAPVAEIHGPEGAVGIVLGPESFSYAVASRAADGKPVLDCVTGNPATPGNASTEPHPSSGARAPHHEK